MKDKSKNKRPKLLIIDKEQFGQLTDLFKWCEYLRNDYDITVLSAKHGRQIVHLNGIKVIYAPFKFPYMIRGIIFLLNAIYLTAGFKGAVIVEYFKGCSAIKLMCPWKKMIVDVRTFSIEADEAFRIKADKMLCKECRHFDLVSAITCGIGDKIGLDTVRILPLGADVISDEVKKYDEKLRILYVGTFINRNIDVMVRGIKMFVERHPELPMTVDIVGDGLPGSLDELKNLSKELCLDSVVTFHGYIPLIQLKPFFDQCNVGLSFVPVTSYYEHQPPTKTFEYIRSGLFCIATETGANKEIINDDNGILIQDTADGLCEGLERYLLKRYEISESRVRESLQDHNWKSISKNYLVPIIEELSQS